ncbi:hypothetical protein [Streptomyces sp. NBC_00162]|uniref:hypothetical protein n=1 Tax=Streptomyces sp. NBC_00162 TaxID=2903629 RepID=UPI00214B3DD4|nr:hypothetical protein [Streptomyces sp. NBC_00162]UUU44070.1 hypothetical protein JIW86_37945 [Streptomyces sp. NBC_00162]
MDLPGISSAAAVGVALLAIPVNVLVVRWQVRAAMKAADSTLRAGLAQADGAYRSALEQSRSAHEQWRRGIREDTWSAYLLATTRYGDAAASLYEATDDQVTAGEEKLDAAAEVFQETFLRVELGGPRPIIELANSLSEELRTLVDLRTSLAPRNRAWQAFLGLLLEGATGEEPSAARIQEAFDAMEALRWQVRQPQEWTRVTPPGAEITMLVDANGDALTQAVHRVEEALRSTPGLTDEHRRELLAMAEEDNALLTDSYFGEWTERVATARAAFLAKAREYLGDDH